MSSTKGDRDWTGVWIGLAIAAGGVLLTLVSITAVQTSGGVGVVFPAVVALGLWKAGKGFVTRDPTWVENDERSRTEARLLRDRHDGDPEL